MKVVVFYLWPFYKQRYVDEEVTYSIDVVPVVSWAGCRARIAATWCAAAGWAPSFPGAPSALKSNNPTLYYLVTLHLINLLSSLVFRNQRRSTNTS